MCEHHSFLEEALELDLRTIRANPSIQSVKELTIPPKTPDISLDSIPTSAEKKDHVSKESDLLRSKFGGAFAKTEKEPQSPEKTLSQSLKPPLTSRSTREKPASNISHHSSQESSPSGIDPELLKLLRDAKQKSDTRKAHHKKFKPNKKHWK